MVDIESANKQTVERMMESRPVTTGVGRAIDVIPGMRDDLLLHAGPPVTWERMAGPMKGAMIGALIFEGKAKDDKEAEHLLSTGKMKWAQRVSGRCALLAVQGHLLEVDERGTLRLLEANPERYVANAELPNLLAFKTWAAPALASGRLYLRDDRHAICLDLRRH